VRVQCFGVRCGRAEEEEEEEEEEGVLTAGLGPVAAEVRQKWRFSGPFAGSIDGAMAGAAHIVDLARHSCENVLAEPRCKALPIDNPDSIEFLDDEAQLLAFSHRRHRDWPTTCTCARQRR